MAVNVSTQQASSAHSDLKSLAVDMNAIYTCVSCIVGHGPWVTLSQTHRQIRSEPATQLTSNQ